jgi:iron complex outermembrane receptor protein
MAHQTWPRRAGFLFAPVSLLAASAHAQAPANAQSPLEEVVVKAMLIDRTLDRVPAAVTVITQGDIQGAQPQIALDEALRRVPGVFMQDRYNFAQDLRISIRGFGARAQFGIRGVKVLVDGIPETLPDGQGAVDSIDLGSTKQIEVIRGPSSSMYGNAAGGVISVASEGAPAEGGPFTDLRVASGSNGYEKKQFKAGGQTDMVNFLVSASDMDLTGWRDQSKAINRQLTSRIDLDLGRNRDFLTIVNRTDQPQSDDAGALTAAQVLANPRQAFPANVTFHAGEAIRQTRVGFVYTAPAGEHGTFRARNYYAWRDFRNWLPVQANGIVDLQRKFVGGGFSYNYSGFWLDRPNRLVAGIDFDNQDDARKRFANLQGNRGALGFDQREHVTSQGMFIQDEISVSKKAQLTLGVRSDSVEFAVTDHYLADGFNDSGSRTFDDTSPMVGFTLQMTRKLSLYTTYSSSFETPTTTEFNKPDGTGGFNQNLNPQIAHNFEVGLRGTMSKRQRYEISVFSTKVKDELIPFEVPTSPGRNYYVNAGDSKHDGVEFLWISNPTEHMTATLSYTYSDFTFNSGKVIPGTAKNVLFGELSYRDPRGWFVSADATYAGDQFGDNTNSAFGKVGAYTLASLRMGWDFNLPKTVVSPYLGVDNLFDETYTANLRLNPVGVGTAAGRYFEPGPPRTAYAGISVHRRYR